MLLTACDDITEPPPPRVTLPGPNEERPVVITGRVINGSTNLGIQMANVRVLDAASSVGTDESGAFRLVVPGRFRGRNMPVHVRAIGFKAQSVSVWLIDDTVSVELPITMDTFSVGCVLAVVVVEAGSIQNETASKVRKPARSKHGESRRP
jgi:hypothetical protein